MRDEADYFRAVLDNLTGGFLSVDLGGKLVYANGMAARILHLPFLETLMGKPYGEALSAFPDLCRVIADALEKQRTVHRAEFSIDHADTPMIIGYSSLQVKSRAGEHLGVGLIFQDLTKRAPR
jgi:nitrogen fixation/metabolism regulation signal transduction histidine kinase